MKKIQELRQMEKDLEFLKKTTKDLEDQKQKLEWSDEFKKEQEQDRPVPVYTYEKYKEGTFGDSTFTDSDKNLLGIRYIKIVQKLKNRSAFVKHLEEYGTICNMPEETNTSVTYYFYNNVLLSTDGGHCFFTTPQLMTDDQRKKFMNGDSEFLKEVK